MECHVCVRVCVWYEVTNYLTTLTSLFDPGRAHLELELELENGRGYVVDPTPRTPCFCSCLLRVCVQFPPGR